jgi:hypothetical protein
MPNGEHVDPAGEPSPAPSPGTGQEGVTADSALPAPGVPRDPAAKDRVQGQAVQVTRIGASPRSDVVVGGLGVAGQHAELRRTRDGRCSIIDLGSEAGTYVNGTRVTRQDLNEGDVIRVVRTTFRLAGGELTAYVDDGTAAELLAGTVITRLERWLELEGVFEVPGVGHVELAGEIDWEPGGGTLYLRRLDDRRAWRIDVPVTARPATPEEDKTALQREQERADELQRRLDSREQDLATLRAELRGLAAEHPAVLPLLDRLGVRPESGA